MVFRRGFSHLKTKVVTLEDEVRLLGLEIFAGNADATHRFDIFGYGSE